MILVVLGVRISAQTPSITNSSKVTTSTSNLSSSAATTTTSTTNRHHHHHHHGIFHHEEPAISVHRVVPRQNDHDLEYGGSHDGVHHENFETKVLKPDQEGGQYELAFFRRLDEEFNKVNKFYRNEVDEVMNEAAVLTKQMGALVAFRVKVKHPESDQGKFEQLYREIAKSASAFSFLSPASSRT
ncbi:hypothetical protein MKX01_031590, partial [Papaver californicum]